MTILVTGGGGFLGGAIVRQLLERGETVRSFSRSAYPELSALGVETVQGDLASATDVVGAVEGVEGVFHVAAKAGVSGRADEYESTNVVGTQNVLHAVRAAGISRLVYTSTPSVVHGGGDVAGVDESMPYPETFSGPYPRTKAEAERIVLAANDLELATVSIRPHLVWGPGDQQLVPQIIEWAQAGRARLIGDGSNLVDSTFIDNAAHAHLLAYDRLKLGSAVAGKAYFVAQGEPLPMSELLAAMLSTVGLPPITKSIPVEVAVALGRIFDALYGGLRLRAKPPITQFLAEQLATAHWYDLSAAKHDLGYKPIVSFAEGLDSLRRSYQI